MRKGNFRLTHQIEKESRLSSPAVSSTEKRAEVDQIESNLMFLILVSDSWGR